MSASGSRPKGVPGGGAASRTALKSADSSLETASAREIEPQNLDRGLRTPYADHP
jgi:hypothetical protein